MPDPDMPDPDMPELIEFNDGRFTPSIVDQISSISSRSSSIRPLQRLRGERPTRNQETLRDNESKEDDDSVPELIDDHDLVLEVDIEQSVDPVRAEVFRGGRSRDRGRRPASLLYVTHNRFFWSEFRGDDEDNVKPMK